MQKVLHSFDRRFPHFWRIPWKGTKRIRGAIDLNCPECGEDVYYAVMDDRQDKDYVHLCEICTNCGFTKVFVDHRDGIIG